MSIVATAGATNGHSTARVPAWRSHQPSRSRAPSNPDAVAVRVVAVARLAVALVVAGAGSFLPDLGERRPGLFLVLGLVWVPVAAVLLFAAETDDNRLALYGGPIADVAVLSLVVVLVPTAVVAALLGYVLVVAFATYAGGKTFAVLLGTIGMAVTILARDGEATSHRVESSTILLFTLVLVAIVFLLDRTAIVQSRTAARSIRFENKAEAILARVADGVVVTDGAGRILQWSPAAERTLGCSAHDAVGMGCDEIVGLVLGERRLDCSTGCPLLAAARGTDDDVLGREAWRTDRHGRRQPLLVNVSAVTNPDGSPAEVVHSIRDITRLKQAEEAKTLFLATASHELKTPLTVIAGFSSALLGNTRMDDEGRREALEAINRRAVELTRIVDRLLLSSRIEAGRVRVVSAAVAVASLVAERAHAMSAATGRAAVVDVDGDDVPDTAGDPQAVVTVVDHLLDNAIKYSPAGGPVAVSVRADDDWVYIAVRDRGIGMDPEQAGHCFDKFWQAESSDVRRFGGTGIGLYIVRSLVEAMGGHVAVESTVGEGSTFTVSLRHFRAGDEGREPEQDPNVGERSSIREFMRQIGVPERVER